MKTFQDILNSEEFKAEIAESLENGFESEEFLNKKYPSGYNQKELRAAFEVIKNPEHWKNPINATIMKEDYEVCNEACMHFTGGELNIIGEGDKTFNVVSDGYFVNVGA